MSLQFRWREGRQGEKGSPQISHPQAQFVSLTLPRDFPAPQGQSLTPVALLIVALLIATGSGPFSTLKVAGLRIGDTADLGSVPCPHDPPEDGSVSQQAPGASHELPAP